MTQTTVEKKAVSFELFEKKVEMEAAYLEYMDRMTREEARKEARKRISQEFFVDKKLD